MRMRPFRSRNVLIPRGLRALPVAFLAVAVLAVLIRFLAPDIFITLTAPVWRLSSIAGSAAYDASSLLKDPAALQRALDAARADTIALTNENKSLKAQLTDLQTLLGSRTNPEPGILASVIARPPESPYDTLTIDEGADAFVIVGALVTGPGGVPLGKVDSVTASAARVTLYSMPHAKTEAWVGDNRVPITLEGIGGGAFEATAPKDAKVIIGDAVYAAGSVSLGTVVRVDDEASSPLTVLRIQPAINPFWLTWVLVTRL
jgi:cell shape-determining protein MreC